MAWLPKLPICHLSNDSKPQFLRLWHGNNKTTQLKELCELSEIKHNLDLRIETLCLIIVYDFSSLTYIIFDVRYGLK